MKEVIAVYAPPIQNDNGSPYTEFIVREGNKFYLCNDKLEQCWDNGYESFEKLVFVHSIKEIYLN